MIRINGERIYHKYIDDSNFSSGVSDSISVMVGQYFSLSVESKTTSIEKVIEISENTTVLIVSHAGDFFIQSSSDSLWLD